MEMFYLIIGGFLGAYACWHYMEKKYEFVPRRMEEDEEPKEEEDENVVDDSFDDEEGDDKNYYYVKFPHQSRAVEIITESLIKRKDKLLYKSQVYEIIDVVHKVDGHSLYVAELYKKS